MALEVSTTLPIIRREPVIVDKQSDIVAGLGLDMRPTQGNEAFYESEGKVIDKSKLKWMIDTRCYMVGENPVSTSKKYGNTIDIDRSGKISGFQAFTGSVFRYMYIDISDVTSLRSVKIRVFADLGLYGKSIALATVGVECFKATLYDQNGVAKCTKSITPGIQLRFNRADLELIGDGNPCTIVIVTDGAVLAAATEYRFENNCRLKFECDFKNRNENPFTWALYALPATIVDTVQPIIISRYKKQIEDIVSAHPIFRYYLQNLGVSIEDIFIAWISGMLQAAYNDSTFDIMDWFQSKSIFIFEDFMKLLVGTAGLQGVNYIIDKYASVKGLVVETGADYAKNIIVAAAILGYVSTTDRVVYW